MKGIGSAQELTRHSSVLHPVNRNKNFGFRLTQDSLQSENWSVPKTGQVFLDDRQIFATE